MKSKALKRVLSVLIVLVFGFPIMFNISGFQAYAAEMKQTPGLEIRSKFDLMQVSEDRVVRAIITLADDSVIDQGIQVRKAQSSDAVNAQKKLLNKQNSIAANLSARYEKLDVLRNYTVLFNGMAIETQFRNLKDIEKMDGITGVYLANQYSVPDVQEEPKTEFANALVGVNNLHNSGYNGDGTVIAILDTGLNVNHEAFADYGLIKNAKLSKSDVENAATTHKGKYISTKIPFSYDYADDDDNVKDSDGHGTHVTGIAAGYAPKVAADGAITTFSGSAPAAQVLSMKIFSDEEGGTDSSIYLAALEDAYILGADVVNMSIGAEAGFAYDKELEDEVYGNIYKKLEDNGVIMCVSAGNEYSKGYNNYNWLTSSAGIDSVLASYTDYGNVGTPSVYDGNLSVASAENVKYPALSIKVGDKSYELVDSCEDGVHGFIDNLGGKEYEYVMVGNYGSPDDYANIDVNGKIAVISRGDITFEEKVEYAANAGAIGAIIYNNEEGVISMQIETFEIPAISVTQTTGDALTAYAADNASPKLFVNDGLVVIDSDKAGTMSDFSCWGTTPELTFKPQITGIGGNVYSADATTNDGYVVYSGTSMSSPNVTGSLACLLQAIYQTTDITDKVEAAQLVEDLSLSTANVLYTEEETTDGTYAPYEYSPRKQGAGLIDVTSALSTEAYIKNPLLALGDDPDKTGKFDMSFTVKRRTAGRLEYSLVDSVMFDFVQDLGDYTGSEDGRYNLLSSDYLADYGENWVTVTSNFKNNVIVLEEGVDEVEVNVTVQLSDEAKAYLDSVFDNGTYIEGYMYLDSEELTLIHASFLAYYGDWCEAPIFEEYDFRDIINATTLLYTTPIDDEGNTYADYGYTVYDVLETNLGFNEAYSYSSLYALFGMGYLSYLGDNLFYYYEHNDEHNAISTELSNGDYYLVDMMVAYPSLLRNARHVIMNVTDVNTGEVYFTDDTEYVRKNIYDEEYGVYSQSSYFAWDGTDLNGEYVPSGTKVMISFDAQLNVEGAELQKNVWSFPLIVDYEAPEIKYNWDAETRQLTVNCTDNHYIQTFDMYSTNIGDENFDGYSEDYLIEEANEDLTFGGLLSEYTYTYDLSDYTENGIYIDVCDYATNGTSLYIDDLSKSQSTMAYNVTLPVAENGEFTVSPITEGTSVQPGESYSFKVLNSNGQETTEFSVYANGETVEPVDGVYTVSNITANVNITVEDKVAPSASVTLNGVTSTVFSDKVDFTATTNEQVTVKASAEDAGSGVAGLYYLVSDKALSEAELDGRTDWTQYSGDIAITDEGSYVVYVKAQDNAGNTTYVNTNGIVIDKTAPEIKYDNIETGNSNVGFTDITTKPSEDDTLFSNTDVTITIDPSDFGEDVSLSYTFSNAVLGEEELDKAEWNEITDNNITVSDAANGTYVYVKAEDNAGNAAYALTNKIVADKTAPIIGGVKNGGVYTGNVVVTVTDENLESVVVNGTKVELENGKFTLTPSDKAQMIIATDKAGNMTVVSVTVNPEKDNSNNGSNDNNANSNPVVDANGTVNTGDVTDYTTWLLIAVASLFAFLTSSKKKKIRVY